MSLHPPLHRPPKVEPARSFRVGLPAGLFFGASIGLALCLVLAPPWAALYAVAPAGLLGMVAAEISARKSKHPSEGAEPWRYDGYCLLVGTLGILALFVTIGSGAWPLGWLLALLLSALGVTAALPDAE